MGIALREGSGRIRLFTYVIYLRIPCQLIVYRDPEVFCAFYVLKRFSVYRVGSFDSFSFVCY